MSRQTLQFIPANLDLTQRPRQAKLANDGVEDIAQVCRLDIYIPEFEDLGDNGVLDQEFADVRLPLAVCVVSSVELTYGRQQDAACFAVADAQRAELGPD